jgi:hypothetical protein
MACASQKVVQAAHPQRTGPASWACVHQRRFDASRGPALKCDLSRRCRLLGRLCHTVAMLLVPSNLTIRGELRQAAAASAGVQAPNEQDHSDVDFALLRYAGGNYDPRPHGLPRLAWEIRKRTSIAMGLTVLEADPSDDQIYRQPLLVWQGDAHFAPLPQTAIDHLRQHLTAGGSLLVDVSDAGTHSPFEAAVRRELARIFPGQPVVPVPANHVVYKSFYLVDRHGGRVANRASLEGIILEGRLAVLISANDLAGAMARDAFGEWEYDVGPGGDTLREMTFRLGINWVMYALCLDYKEDQVHLPFILQRRR